MAQASVRSFRDRLAKINRDLIDETNYLFDEVANLTKQNIPYDRFIQHTNRLREILTDLVTDATNQAIRLAKRLDDYEMMVATSEDILINFDKAMEDRLTRFNTLIDKTANEMYSTAAATSSGEVREADYRFTRDALQSASATSGDDDATAAEPEDAAAEPEDAAGVPPPPMVTDWATGETAAEPIPRSAEPRGVRVIRKLSGLGLMGGNIIPPYADRIHMALQLAWTRSRR